MVVGHVKGPVRLLPCKQSWLSTLKLASSDGIVPTKRLSLSAKVYVQQLMQLARAEEMKHSHWKTKDDLLRFESSPKMVGVAPVSLFCFVAKVPLCDYKEELRNDKQDVTSDINSACSILQGALARLAWISTSLHLKCLGKLFKS